jgi:hypothetical protein
MAPAATTKLKHERGHHMDFKGIAAQAVSIHLGAKISTQRGF